MTLEELKRLIKRAEEEIEEILRGLPIPVQGIHLSTSDGETVSVNLEVRL